MTDAEYYRKYNQTIRGKSKRLHLNKQLYCRKQHIKYDLNADWIEERIRRGCELTGLSFKIKTSGVFHPLGPSIDRIDPQLGYTKENCRLILHALNNMKSWADDDLMYFIADALIKAKGKKTKPIKYDAKENKFQKEKKLVLIKDGDMTQIFTKRQKEIAIKRLKDKTSLSKTESEYYSRIIKKKLAAIANKDVQKIVKKVLAI